MKKQRGRKSVGELAPKPANPVLLVQKRPGPPVALNPSMAGIWHSVTGCYPADHFRADTQPLLEMYCRHVDTAQVLNTLIDGMKPEWLKSDEGLARYKTLLDMREKETRAVTALARSMRLTQQAQYSTRKAATIAENTRTGPAPWD